MEALSAIERIVRDLLVFVVAMSAILAALIVIISRMPNDNPLKRIMVALSYRVGATAAAGMLVIPATPIPGLDMAIDIGAPIALIWYWWTFFRDARRGGLEEPAAVRFVRANGLVLHYLIEGPDALAPLVFVNPLGCDLRVWSEVASILKPEFRVVCYDKRGHGLSESGPDRCEMADYARDLAALLDAIEIRRAVIIGISIGGVIAQELARQRPELVGGARSLRHGGEGRNRPIVG